MKIIDNRIKQNFESVKNKEIAQESLECFLSKKR